jgi:cardiolipin synthase
MVRVTGPLAQSVQSAFAELWAYVCGEVLTGPAHFPRGIEENGSIRSLSVVSSPASEEQPLHLLLFKTFMSARKRLWITTPYFMPPKSTHEQLIDRANAGVDVRILLPNYHTDAKAVRHASQASFQKLLDAGVRIFEYQPSMLHTKTIVVDSIWSIVGSANMDIRSAELNEEVVLGIRDEAFARELETTFERDLERAVEIDADEWRRRGLGKRAIERVSGVFSEQY